MIMMFIMLEVAYGSIPNTFYMEERLAMLYNNFSGKSCIGGFIKDDLLLTCSSCLGEYSLVKDQENMSLYKFTPYLIARLSIIRLHGKVVNPLKIYIHDFFSMAVYEMDLFKYDLGIVQVTPKHAYIFQIPKSFRFHSESGVCYFFYKTKAGKMRKHSVNPWFEEFRTCDFSSICGDDRECEIDFVYSMENDGIRCINERILSVDLDVVGSPIICDGVLQGVVTKFLNYDIYFSALFHETNHEFIVDVIKYL